MKIQKITPFLWFDTEAEEAANFYVSTFKNSKILSISRYPEEGQEITGKEPGSVMVVAFEIEGMKFNALNGGPMFKINQAISFVINCKDQAEVDYYWDKLGEGGAIQQCGWVVDRFGVAWQVTPIILDTYMADPNKEKVNRVMKAMLQMVKLDIKTLEKACTGE